MPGRCDENERRDASFASKAAVKSVAENFLVFERLRLSFSLRTGGSGRGDEEAKGAAEDPLARLGLASQQIVGALYQLNELHDERTHDFAEGLVRAVHQSCPGLVLIPEFEAAAMNAELWTPFGARKSSMHRRVIFLFNFDLTMH